MASPAVPVPHRPSRRAQIVEAAMRLHARQDGRPVTVAEIAREAYMTTPAIYYHYPSKDAVLLDGLRGFADDLAAEITAAGSEAVRTGRIDDLVASVIRWLDGRRHEAIVWYLTAPQVVNADALRNDLAAQTLPALRAAVRATRGGAAGPGPIGTAPTDAGPTRTAPTRTAPTRTAPTRTAPTGTAATGTGPTEAEVDVVVLALNSLLEIAAQSWLTEDQVRRVLGPRNFLAEVSRLTVRLAGTGRRT